MFDIALLLPVLFTSICIKWGLASAVAATSAAYIVMPYRRL